VTLVVDASVAVKWFVPEARSKVAEEVLAVADDLLAPDLLPVEVANALWKKIGRREVSVAEAAEVLDVLRTTRLEIRPAAPLLERALELATALDHPVYDCVYLALAEACRARLVTDDASLIRRLRRRRGLPPVVALSAFKRQAAADKA
jgi:predicted nucleic acid-binding protein